MANERLRDALLRQGMTAADLAEAVGVDPKTVERWITQESRAPYARHRHVVATRLQQSESYLWPDAVAADRVARAARSEVVEFYPRRALVPASLWQHMFDSAAERVDILVYAALFLPEQQPQLIRTLREKADAGLRARILLGDPDSPEVLRRSGEEGIGDAIPAKVRNALAFYTPLRDVSGVSINLHGTTLYNSIYRFDDEMLVNMHVYGFPAAHAPAMHLRRLTRGDLFDTYMDSFERVWSNSASAWTASAEGKR